MIQELIYDSLHLTVSIREEVGWIEYPLRKLNPVSTHISEKDTTGRYLSYVSWTGLGSQLYKVMDRLQVASKEADRVEFSRSDLVLHRVVTRWMMLLPAARPYPGHGNSMRSVAQSVQPTQCGWVPNTPRSYRRQKLSRERRDRDVERLLSVPME
jgi:hypothetical protein